MKNTLSTIASLILSLFFSCIVFFVLFDVLHILDLNIALPAMVFTIINLLSVIDFIGFGKSLSNAIGIGMYTPICLATIAYTAIHFTLLGFLYNNDSSTTFVLFNLILLFVYFLVIIPLGVTGYNSNKNKN